VDIPSRIELRDYVVDEEQLGLFNMPGSPAEFSAIVTYRVKDGKIGEVVIAA